MKVTVSFSPSVPERDGYIVALASRAVVHNSSGHGFLWDSDESYMWVHARMHVCKHSHTHTLKFCKVFQRKLVLLRLMHTCLDSLILRTHIEHSAYWYKSPSFKITKLSSHNVSTIPISLGTYPLPQPTSVFLLIFFLINLFSIPSQLCFSPSVLHMPWFL